MTTEQSTYIHQIYTLIARYSPFAEEVCWFIACQFALESNFGKSDLATSSFNHCGMRKPVVRPTLALSYVTLPFAHYNSLDDCIVDYMLCITFRKPMSIDLSSVSRYIAFIKGWYCPETDYTDKILSIYKQLNH